MEKIKKGYDYDKIASEHQRTVNAIKSHIMDMHVKKVLDQEMTLEDASALVKIPLDEFTRHKAKFEKKMTVRAERRKMGSKAWKLAKETSKTVKPTIASVPQSSKTEPVVSDKHLAVLMEIRDYLKIISEK